MRKLLNVFALIGISAPANSFGFCPDEKEYQVIILPATGGENTADRVLQKALCQRGHPTKILDYTQGSGVTTDPSVHDYWSKKFLQELDQYLKENPKPTFLIGASLGGLYASLAFGYSRTQHEEAAESYPHLKLIEGIVLTVAGGPLAEVLTSSKLASIEQQRSMRFEASSYDSIKDYQQDLEAQIYYDPLRWAQAALSSRVLMFNSKNDKVVPTSNQEKLWLAWGRPKVKRFLTNHLLTIGRVYFFYEEEIDQFLRAQAAEWITFETKKQLSGDSLAVLLQKESP